MTKLTVGEASLCSDHPQNSDSNNRLYWQQYQLKYLMKCEIDSKNIIQKSKVNLNVITNFYV